MALGADASDNYGAMATPLYERARAYAKMDESNVCHTLTGCL
jgi:hypothetical protein